MEQLSIKDYDVTFSKSAFGRSSSLSETTNGLLELPKRIVNSGEMKGRIA
jgi:hypothetical protein